MPVVVKQPNDIKLLDKALKQLNDKMLTALPWLENAFGSVQRLTRNTVGNSPKKVSYPAIYKGSGTNKYIDMLPTSKYGNAFTYYQITDYSVKNIPNQPPVITAKFGLILWFNASKLFDNEVRNIELVKSDVLDFFSTSTVIYVDAEINKVFERNEDIYKEYGTSVIEQQYLMHPYGGLRFEGVIKYAPHCIN